MSPESTGKSTEQGTTTGEAKGAPSLLRAFTAALLVVLPVLGLCWIFYQNQVATKQEYLMERNFRYLAGRGESLRQVIDGYKKMFESIRWNQRPGDKSVTDAESLCQVSSSILATDKCKEDKRRKVFRRLLAKQLGNLPYVKHFSIEWKGSDSELGKGDRPSEKQKEEEGSNGDESATKNGGKGERKFVEFNRDDFVLRYEYPAHEDGSPVQEDRTPGTRNDRYFWLVKAHVDLEEVMNLLPVESIFGDLLLTDSQGTVVHQKRSARHTPEYRFANIAHLVKKAQGKQGDKDRERIVPPVFERFLLGDTEYLIFGQAGHWPFGQATAKKDQGEDKASKKDKKEQESFDFLVVGILPSHDFYVQAKTIPTSYLLVTLGLILVGALSLPYLRLQSIRSSDALSQGDVLALLYCIVLWVGAATFLVVILSTYLFASAKFDEKLKEAAGEIHDSFLNDLKDAKKQLEHFDDLLTAQCKQECAKNGKVKDKELWLEQLTISPDDNAQKKYQLKLENPAESDGKTDLLFYDLSKVLWVNKDGEKRVDWSWKPSKSRVRLADREYVKQIQSGEPFWVESIYSWTTGENFAMVSTKSRVSPIGEPWVAALQGKLPSVMETVVLPGMGFAVIDQEGKVQFHSDPRRNLRENFLAETDHDEKLQAIIWTHKSVPSPAPYWTRKLEAFSGQYWGKDRRFYVTPVNLTPLNWERSTNPGTSTGQESQQGGKETQEAKGPPKWWLVVYLDQDVLEAPLLEAGFFAVALFVVYAVLILGVGFFWFLINRLLKSEQGGPIWPHEEHACTYAGIFILNFLLLTLYGFTAFHLVPGLQNWSSLPELFRPFTLPLVGIFLLPSFLIVFIYLVPPRKISRLFPKFLVPNYRLGYLLMSVSALLLFAVLPAFDFFTMAYRDEMRMYAEFSQFDYKNDLNRVKQHVTDYYKGVFDASKGNASQANKLREDFIDKRTEGLDESSIKTFLFSPAEQPILSNLLPLYAPVRRQLDVRRLLDGQFGTETARFLEKGGTDPDKLTPTKNTLPAVRWYLYCGLMASGLVPYIPWWRLFRWLGLTSDGPKGTVPKDISIRLLLLLVLSTWLSIVLIWPGIGFLLMSALLFACVSCGLPKMVATQVFFLWQPRKKADFAGDVRAQWGECSWSEKLTLFHLAQDRFLTAQNEGLASLESKGLVRFAPNPQLVKDKDGKDDHAFIKEMFRKETSLLQSLEEEKPVKLGEQAIWAMKVGLFSLAGFILYTQEEFRPAVLAALAPALPTLLRLPLGLDPSKLLEILTLRKKG